MTSSDIIKILSSATEKDKELIQKAYDFAENAHKDKKRFSGEPYFIHCFETAKELANLNLDAVTIAAGLLHDSIEDGVASEKEIKDNFGDEVLFLINGVTKLGKVKYRGAERFVESFRKFLVAAAQDVRVLIIKLADRLHNMRTLEYVRPDKQKRIALETIEIYSPLAYRLGIRKLSRELEDLSFIYLDKKNYSDTEKLMSKKKDENLPNLERFLKSVKKALAKEDVTNFQTDYRQKGVYSLFKKLEIKGNDIEKIYDIIALRVCVETVADCYKVLGIIHSSWVPLPGRIKDYIAFPKPNGYQSLHTTVFTGDGAIVEIQIRTHEMQHNAEYGLASHLAYKDNNTKDTSDMIWFRQLLPKNLNFAIANRKKQTEDAPTWVKELAESQKNIITDSEKSEFMSDVKTDFFGQRIFVFTPKGEVVDLPIGSTVLDFSYAIHSDVGEHTNSAKINGKMVSLKTELKNGDIAEISTKESSKPSSKWSEIVKTNLAKRCIKNYLDNEKKNKRK
jgi:guanosine-3',5'-bis(diphosphate) 3'-pyrophosphohydrolase